MPDGASLSLEQSLYRSIFDCSPDAIVVIDESDGGVKMLNGAARRLPGISLERLFSADGTWAAELRAFRSAVRARGHSTMDLPVVGTDGSTRVFSLDAAAHDAHHVVVVRDVTEVRRLESEVRHLRRIESVGQLTASVVHDFSNLLTPIVCLSTLLERSLERDGRDVELARDIRSAGERAAVLVRQMLSFARREPARRERVNVGGALAELRALVARVAGVGVELDLVLDEDVGDAIVDREQLEHVVLNVAANARDAMPDGGRLTIRTANVMLGEDEAGALGGGHRGSYVALTITDTGVGMSREVRERIFERFFTTKAAGHGTGLGLATARHFAAENGGCIAVHSEPGQGTTVVIYLPRSEVPPHTSAVTAIAQESPRGTETVLVVDDDDLVRGALRAVLEDAGYRVLEAQSAEAALAIVSTLRETIALLIVDVVLPKMSGCELARRVRAVRSTKVLFTSGHTTRVLEKHGLREDDGALLRKAFTPGALVRRVREMLDGEAKDEAACG